ncbi:copper resistance CopC family protein [Nucisporomicrobium flavum]|uniref:copper resistance CopC family protein n=1 Tax=Nucisporomicrobium flavum TaxID=2785915 RepID=UPI003C2CC9CA
MRILRFLTAAVVAAVVAVSAAGPAEAHNAMVEAVPAKNAVLKKAPKGVELRFLQELDDRFLTIVVTGPDKQKIATGTPEADGKVGSVAFTDALPNGGYTVAYRVVSRDGHPVQGSYAFSVRDPAEQTRPAEPVAPSPAALASASPAVVPVALAEDEGMPWWPVAAVAAGVVLAGAGALLVARRRH